MIIVVGPQSLEADDISSVLIYGYQNTFCTPDINIGEKSKCSTQMELWLWLHLPADVLMSLNLSLGLDSKLANVYI